MSQTDPEARPDDPRGAAAIAAVGPRPRRRWWILALVAVVLVAAAITGAVVVSGRNEDAPVEAVRAYVDAIARGDATAANALVDPKSFGPGVDPALLTDEVLRSATQRITVGEINLDFSADLDADVVEVDVDYTLGNVKSVVMLRAKRAGTTAGLLHEWRVIDPLLVPVRVQTNESSQETAGFGAGTVPVSGSEYEGFPQHRFFVYPGVYPLHGHESRYLAAQPEAVAAANRDYGERPSEPDNDVVDGTVYYRATSELKGILTDRMAKHVTACLAAVPKPPTNCPDTLLNSVGLLRSARLDRQPVIQSIQSYQVVYRGERTEPPLRMVAGNGSFSYTDTDGDTGDEPFRVYARITVTPDDDLTIAFTTDL